MSDPIDMSALTERLYLRDGAVIAGDPSFAKAVDLLELHILESALGSRWMDMIGGCRITAHLPKSSDEPFTLSCSGHDRKTQLWLQWDLPAPWSDRIRELIDASPACERLATSESFVQCFNPILARNRHRVLQLREENPGLGDA